MSDGEEKIEERRISLTERQFLPVMESREPLEIEEWSVGGEAAAESVDPETLRTRIIERLKTVYDPEIPVNIYDLGLIYGCDIGEHGEVELRMTLTAPGCPVAGPLVREVAEKVGAVDGVGRAHVKLVWDPPWSMERMSEEARLELGLL